MRIARTIEDLRATVGAWRAIGDTVGFVPTMGALHAGHLALLEASRRDCTRSVASIFVNPIQFNSASDLAGYPKDEAQDLAELETAGCDLVFMPPAEVMYPTGFVTRVALPALADCLCGVTRPGHMTGVATVVAKLFLQVAPGRAYFGEKDFQQLLIVRRMARDLDMPLTVVGVPTVREADGLALSSRNRNLTADERRIAPALYQRLQALARDLHDGCEAAAGLTAAKATLIETGFAGVDYLELRTEEELRELARAEPPCRLFAAAWLGETRLIDNLKVL